MFQIVQTFHPALSANVRQGICTALQQILDKRVLASLAPLFEAPKFDRELRSLIRETFPEFCTAAPVEPPIAVPDRDIVELVDVNNEVGTNNHVNELDAKFSDDENDENKSPLKKTNNKINSVNERRQHATTFDFNSHIEVLSPELQTVLQELHNEK